jgi:hypothetical protein
MAQYLHGSSRLLVRGGDRMITSLASRDFQDRWPFFAQLDRMRAVRSR